MRYNWIIILLVLTVNVLASPLAATTVEPLYRVEIIIFENRQLTQADIERWPKNPPLPAVQGAQQLSAFDPQNPKVFQLLLPSALQLSRQASNIIRDPNYNVLLHVAWLQPLTENSIPVHLYAQDDFTSINALPPYGTEQKWKLDGVIALRKHNYCMLDADLILSKQKPDEPSSAFQSSSSNNESIVYRLKQQQRMRENELYYIDNPVFGALVKVSRGTLPEAVPAATPADSTEAKPGTRKA
jgi:Peptidoglycan-binding protein, CsiV